MNSTNKFRTKTGYCHITPDQIILTRNDVAGDLSNVSVGKTNSRILILFGLLSILLGYLGYKNYALNRPLIATVMILLATYLVTGLIRSVNYSITPLINRKDISRVSIVKGIPLLTRSRFEVEFLENGKVKKRMIMLPGSVNDGSEESKRAIQIMREENLLQG